ncbi:alpha/beta fold hydrolase [Maricurvus nonylphenolicus]|uniref:alpha/beta fold hydrolase n=1 Tax=Maricurvus nonylphenolicus TaxID=1008307 RepID=UPI0036F22928
MVVRVILSLVALCFGGLSHAASEAVKVYSQLYPSSPMLTEGYAQVAGRRLHYVTAGEGPLVIMHHGFPGFWYVWKNQIAALSESYRVVALDGLGANLSDKPQQLWAYDIGRLAEGLDLLAQQLAGDEPFILIGHDWGGALAWSYAQQYPQRLHKLIVLNAPPYNLFLDLLRENKQQQKASTYVEVLKQPVVEYMLTAGDAYLIWRSAYQKAVGREFLTQREGELFRQALAVPGAVAGGINWYRANVPKVDHISVEDYWPRSNPVVRVPSLLVWGEKDKTFVPEFLETLPGYVSDLTIEVIAGAGHKPNLSHPQQVNRLLRQFLCDSEC